MAQLVRCTLADRSQKSAEIQFWATTLRPDAKVPQTRPRFLGAGQGAVVRVAIRSSPRFNRSLAASGRSRVSHPTRVQPSCTASVLSRMQSDKQKNRGQVIESGEVAVADRVEFSQRSCLNRHPNQTCPRTNECKSRAPTHSLAHRMKKLGYALLAALAIAHSGHARTRESLAAHPH